MRKDCFLTRTWHPRNGRETYALHHLEILAVSGVCLFSNLNWFYGAVLDFTKQRAKKQRKNPHKIQFLVMSTYIVFSETREDVSRVVQHRLLIPHHLETSRSAWRR